MKLCYLSSSRIPSRTANGVHVMKICEAFAELGHQVTLFAKRTDDRDVDAHRHYGVERCFDVRFMPLETGLRRQAWLRFRLRRQIRALRPDLVYGRSARSLLAVAPLGVPFVFEGHMIPSSDARRETQRRLFAAPNFRRLVVISGALKEDYLAEFPSLAPEQVRVAHDAASPAGHPPRPNRRGPRPRIGYVGHLYPGKGMETIDVLASQCPWADFHVVGGTEEDLARWRPRVAGRSNMFLHGFVPHAEVGDLIESFDIAVAPYGARVEVHGGGGVHIERWISPLKLFEYMSRARPIIASDLPVIREVLENERNALLAPPQNADAWEKQIRRLWEDPELARRLGERALADFDASYSWTARARAVVGGLGPGAS